MTLEDDITGQLATGSLPLRTVLIGAGARHQLVPVLDGLVASSSPAVLMDGRRYRTPGGEDVKAALLAAVAPGRTVTSVVLDGEVHADERTVELARRRCSAADAVVTVGSGTLCDIGKVAAGSRPHVVVQTAASVNGFADDQSVLLVNGVKRTTASAWPTAILVDEEILAGAPAVLNRAGLGDMISMFTAPADWYLSSLVGMDRGYSDTAARMTRRYGSELLALADGIGRSVPGDLATLARFLTLSGLSMGAAGQTSPSSGMEHTVSHLLDMANGARGPGNAHHGEQVGVATILAAVLWRRMLQRIDAGDLRWHADVDADAARAEVDTAFGWMDERGATARECWADYDKKRRHLGTPESAARLRQALLRWDEHRPVLAGLVGQPEEIVAALRAAGAPTRFSRMSRPVRPDAVRWALANCHRMRNRFTVADLAARTGHWGAHDVESVLEEADELDAGA